MLRLACFRRAVEASLDPTKLACRPASQMHERDGRCRERACPFRTPGMQGLACRPVGAGHAPPVRDACDLLIGWTNDPNVCRERACPFRTPGRALLLFGIAAEGVVLLFSREKRSRKASDTRPFGQIPLNAHFSGRGRATGRARYAWGGVLSLARGYRVRVLIRPEKGRGICPRALLSPL